MDDQSARLFLCACCRAQVLVCRKCDRGQRSCADGCAAMSRQALQRDCAQRYLPAQPRGALEVSVIT